MPQRKMRYRLRFSVGSRCLFHLSPSQVHQIYSMSRVPGPRKGLLHVRAPKITGSARRTVPSAGGGGRGPAAKGGDEGYLYLAGVRDASKRITEYSVSLLPLLSNSVPCLSLLLHAT